jgi:hypothetical protein
MKHIALIFAGFLISTFIFTHTSCKKTDTDCIASIRCVDSTGKSLPNASVLLYATVQSATNPAVTYTADLKANGTTDNAGQVKFTFQFPAIYDVLATATVNSKTITGTSIIKLEVGETIAKTVTVK